MLVILKLSWKAQICLQIAFGKNSRKVQTVNEVFWVVKGTGLQLPSFKDRVKSIMSGFYKAAFPFALIFLT